MTKAIRVYIGYDPVDDKAFKVCGYSLLKHASIPVEIIPVVDRELRAKELYWRTYHINAKGQKFDNEDLKPFSTEFSFTRFAVPLMNDFGDDLVLFCDPDMLWRGDIADLMDDTYPHNTPVFCVHHQHAPEEKTKMLGQTQTLYYRKNWSSFMLMRPSQCRGLGYYALNHMSGADLHAMAWVGGVDIGELNERWNWLEGHSTSPDPSVVHFTRGTPDMIGNDIPFADEWWAAYAELLSDAAEWSRHET